MKKYYGNYLGIIIQNNDPLARGRVKIFVPHISPTVYKNWNEIPEDKKFKFLGANINSDLNNIYEDLKKILPWSICASPITGEMSTGRLNTKPNYASTSDSSYSEKGGFEKTEFEKIDFNDKTSGKQNIDGIGEKEGNVYEKYRFKVNDAFNSAENNINNVNLNSYNYTPSVYSNKTKGSFAIPSVGAHVWVFFHDGDPLFPVYFAASYGQDDWQQMYGGEAGYDYPGGFENTNEDDNESDLEYYKNKYIINQKGGTIEFVNSDYRESIKISGYNGSFKQFALKTNVELAVHDDQRLVLQDQYDTVRGFRNVYTERDLDYIVRGDYYLKTGNLKSEYFNEWKEIVGAISEIKQLFELKRAEKIDAGPYLKLTSPLQERDGDFGVCPVCLGGVGREYLVTNNSKSDYDAKFAIVFMGIPIPISQLISNNFTKPKMTSIPPVARCPVCNGTGFSPSSENGIWEPDPRKTLDAYKSQYKSQITKLADIEKKMGLGGNYIIDITKNKVETIGLVMNDFGNIRMDDIGKISNNGVSIDEDGAFVRMKESPMFEYVHVDDLPGGSYSLNVANRFNVLVGAGGLSMKSYGSVEVSGTITNVAGEQLNLSSEFETNIQGGKRLSLEADLVSIKNKQGGQVLIDSNLGVNGNAIIKGGLHVDGELSVNHITAPLEYQETEDTQ
ncbi:hypothetical protein KAR91_19185, partial [Candidatus Pacearchaeota archaeon]|nr:hypothetical protein [Candidatus Pacearchaeota archaeon]